MIERLRNMIMLGRVTLTDESGPIARVQVDQGPVGPGATRILDKVKRFSQFGLASVPPLASEVLMVALGGLRDQVIALATNHQPTRPTGMQPGDVRLYDARGAMVDLSAAGIVIDAAGMAVTIRNAAKVRVECEQLECTGDLVSRADGQAVSLNGVRDAYFAGTPLAGSTKKTV